MTDLGNMGFLWILITVGLLIRSKTRSIGLTAALAIVLNAAHGYPRPCKGRI